MRKKTFDRYMKMSLKPEEWCVLLDMEILDADGWRGEKGKDFGEKIGLEEFRDRALVSTVRGEWLKVVEET